ncbi:D-alanyl-D-alanine carboxypeptidase PBP3 [Streptococcus castoreus]|uniref:D-alanyl-D-alanine carboxypeptidase PBP3 n=1 Tax=Streptococcus castoreus TaxID=254786 RepID=UPI0004896851|nr:D-alanyl-D-alanine carboxypeptidase PBP3 [Streptococcus castoreus]
MIKKGCNLLVFLTWLWVSSPVLAKDFQVGAEHAIAVEAASGRVLYEKDAQTPDAIASLTKLVTVYLVLNRVKVGQVNLSDQVSLSDYAFGLTADRSLSNVSLEKKPYSIKDLLTACLVASSNSAAIALAEHVAGSEPKFVDQMREQLARWGIRNVKIVNASGLPNEILGDNRYPGSSLEEENEMSAQDLAIVVMHLLDDFPEVLNITKQAEADFAGTRIKSFNRLLPGRDYGRKTVDGLKTGTTEMAGHCLITTSTENGMRVITVIMNADGSEQEQNTRFEQTNCLLDYINQTYQRYTILKKGQVIPRRNLLVKNGREKTVAIYPDKDLTLVLRHGEKLPSSKYFAISEDSLLAPIVKHQTVAYLISPRVKSKLIRYLKSPERIAIKGKWSVGKNFTLQIWWQQLVEKFK